MAEERIALWPEGAPGSEEWTHEEQEGMAPPPIDIRVVRNVVRPTLTAFLPERGAANGTGVLVAPGGAFHFLAIQHEGLDVARWLNERGAAAFVLRYRLVQTPVDNQDFERQMRENRSDRSRMQALMNQVRPLSIADGQQAVRVA